MIAKVKGRTFAKLSAAGRHAAGTALAAALVFSVWVRPAAAQAVREERPTGYWAANGAIAVGGFGLGALSMLLDAEPSPFLIGPWDESTLGMNNPHAGRIADATLLTTIGLPLPMLIEGTDERTAAAMLIYAEAHSVNFLLNAVAKFSVRRPRPYSYEVGTATVDYECEHDAERCLSFYSGHASTAFTAAVSSVMLVSESPRIPRGVRLGAWGVQLGLAGATAHLRVRAGMHFPSDVIVGALVGSAIGVGVPLLHRDVWSGGERYEHTEPGVAEFAVGAMGLVTGAALPWLIEAKRPAGAYSVRPTTMSGTGTGLELFGTW